VINLVESDSRRANCVGCEIFIEISHCETVKNTVKNYVKNEQNTVKNEKNNGNLMENIIKCIIAIKDKFINNIEINGKEKTVASKRLHKVIISLSLFISLSLSLFISLSHYLSLSLFFTFISLFLYLSL
jgi:hypothetical protein